MVKGAKKTELHWAAPCAAVENGFVLQIFIVELVALQDQIPEFLDRKPILALSVSLRGRSWLGWQRAVFRR